MRCSAKRVVGAGVSTLLMLMGLSIAGRAPDGGRTPLQISLPTEPPEASTPDDTLTVRGVVRPQQMNAFGKLPLYFIENRGQADRRVAYYVTHGGATVYFTPGGLTIALLEAPGRRLGDWDRFLDRLGPPFRMARAFAAEPEREHPPQRWAVKVDFVGARDVRPVGEVLTPAIVSYFKGRPEQWHTGLKTYARVRYADLWPGIDLVYTGNDGRLKYTFVVKPGADPSIIRLAYRGATAVRVSEAGQLEIATPAGGFAEASPYAYQEVGRRRVEVKAGYALEAAEGRDGARVVRFEVGAYDRSRPLILDPLIVFLSYSGYIGGSGGDGGFGIAVDSAGNAYVTGGTGSSSATFPETVGPDLSHNGSGDIFVAKLNASGTGLVYAGYIGGSDGDTGRGIAVDGFGNAYVTGSTRSTSATFPETVGPDLVHNGGVDAFVVKVNAAGTSLLYAGYVGGSSNDEGFGIAVDSAGNAYVTGLTGSSQSTFPVTVGPDLTHNGLAEAFVAKVNAAGTGFVYAGYIGGSSTDAGTGIAVDSAGSAYLTGYTASSQDFPVTVGPDLTYNLGDFDAFVAKVNAAGTGLLYAGYIGGSGFDVAHGVAVDSAGNAYLTGRTDSSQATFPETVGPDLTHNGGPDAFVVKVNATGTGLLYAGYIGGSGGDVGHGIAVDSAGNAYLTGRTTSSQTTFPETVGPDLTYNGTEDAFVAKVNAAGTGLIYAGYVGGSSQDLGFSIAVNAGSAYVTGMTSSSQVTFPETVGPDLTHNGVEDAFVAKVRSIFIIFIDLLPGIFPNRLDLSSTDPIPVAVLTTRDFDAATVDVRTLRLAGTPPDPVFPPDPTAPVRSALQDVDGDGDVDLLTYFDPRGTSIGCRSRAAVLTGRDRTGEPLEGRDSVMVIVDRNGQPCRR